MRGVKCYSPQGPLMALTLSMNPAASWTPQPPAHPWSLRFGLQLTGLKIHRISVCSPVLSSRCHGLCAGSDTETVENTAATFPAALMSQFAGTSRSSWSGQEASAGVTTSYLMSEAPPLFHFYFLCKWKEK